MREPEGDSRRKKPPIPNTYWRGPWNQETLWARLEIQCKPIRWSLRLRWPLRKGDLEIARARVEAKREGLIAAVHYGEHRKRTDEVIMSWAERHVIHQVAASTAQRYGVSLKQLKPYLEGTFIDELDRAKMRDIVDGRRAAGASTATICRDLTALADVIDYAVDQEWREDDYNPALTRLKRLKERRDPIVLPERAHVFRVIKDAPPKMAPLIEAALLTGCRLSELTTARYAGVDHARRQLTVTGKGNKLRVIELVTPAGDAYEVIRRTPTRLGCPWLFWHHDGEPFRAASKHFHELVEWVMGKATGEAKAAQIEHPDFRPFRFHDLRHLFAVDFLKAGGGIYTLQKHLGHTSVQTTEIYLKYLTPEEAQRVKAGSAELVTAGARA